MKASRQRNDVNAGETGEFNLERFDYLKYIYIYIYV